MFYDFAITVPANTPEASAVEQELKLAPGVIHHVEIQFPAGCAELARCQVYYLERQVWPSNPEGSFASDGWVISFREHLELERNLYKLRVKLWNDDTANQHTITIRIGVLPKVIVSPLAGVSDALRKLLRLMGVRS